MFGQAAATFGPIQQAAYHPPTSPAAAAPTGAPSSIPFDGLAELTADALVEQVLSRNPTVAQMVAAYQAVSARYPQVTSLDDPMFGVTIGPDTFAPDDPGTRFAWRLEISQKYPWPGKLPLRGDNALAEARAAGNDVEDTRLQLAESARSAFYDYYLVERALEVNREGFKLLEDFKQNAATRYKTGLAPQQDYLQADVEMGQQRERRVTLERMREVVVARLNTLMHLPPDAPLPPPPVQVTLPAELPPTAALREAALARRPDLKALADHIAAKQAALALACKEFYPDFEPFMMYDRFMGNAPDNRDLATQLGVRLNLPVRLARRRGAVAEAQARLAQRQAELDRQLDQVNLQVQDAAAQVRESERVVALYEKEILKAARENVKSAQAAYVTGKIPFLSLIEAQRNVVNLQDRYYEAVAAYGRRLTTLDRVIGGSLPGNPALLAVPGATASPEGAGIGIPRPVGK
jgi:outer membrane protein TolC